MLAVPCTPSIEFSLAISFKPQRAGCFASMVNCVETVFSFILRQHLFKHWIEQYVHGKSESYPQNYATLPDQT